MRKKVADQTWQERLDAAKGYTYDPYRCVSRFELSVLRFAIDNILNPEDGADRYVLEACLPLWRMNGGGRGRPSTVLEYTQKFLLSGGMRGSAVKVLACALGLAGGETKESFAALYEEFRLRGLTPPWTYEDLFWSARGEDVDHNRWGGKYRRIDRLMAVRRYPMNLPDTLTPQSVKGSYYGERLLAEWKAEDKALGLEPVGYGPNTMTDEEWENR